MMSFWHQAPFIRFVLPLLAGVILGAFIPHSFSYSLAILSSLALAFLLLSFLTFYLKYMYRWIYGSLLAVLLFCIGYEITVLNTDRLQPHHYSKILSPGDQIIASIAEPAVKKEKSLKTVVDVKAVVRSGEVISARGKILCYFEKDSLSQQLQYGNLLVFKTPLTEVPPPQNPSEFNYKLFLSFHRIYDQVFLKSSAYRILDNSPSSGIMGLACRARNYLMRIFEQHKITGDEYAVASALMLGSREEIDKDLVQAYASSGALHVLSVSGLHVGIIFIVMNSLLAFIEKFKYGRISKTILLLIGLWFYAILTGLSPSVVRASTMFSFIVVGKAGRRNTNIYNILACSAFFLLLMDPYIIMEVGFQLSFLAVLGIVFIQPKLSMLWDAYIPAAGRVGNWIIEQTWAVITVSIAAQLATFALGLLYFHQFPNYFLFSNLIVIPLSTLVIYCGVLLFAVSSIPLLSDYIAFAFKNLIMLLNKSVIYIEQLPFSLLQGISISIAETWLIYLLIILMLCFFILQKIKMLHYFLIVLSALLLYQLGEGYFQQKQKKLAVYNISNVSALDFIDGKKNYLLADSSFLNNSGRLLFHVRHYWWDLGLDENIFLDRKDTREIKKKNIFLKDNFAQFYDKRIALINKKIFPADKGKKMKVNYLVLSKNAAISIDKLVSAFDFEMIIFDSSNSNYAVRRWMRQAEKAGVPCYSVKHKGAFIAEL